MKSSITDLYFETRGFAAQTIKKYNLSVFEFSFDNFRIFDAKLNAQA